MARACILVALLAAACTTTVSSALSTTNEIGTWTNVFQSHTVDGIAGLSCNTDTSCYVFGKSLYSFNGAPNGILTPLTVPNPLQSIATVVVSGPMDAPGGVVVDSLGKLGYPVNNMTFVPSNTPVASVKSAEARASTNGQEVLVINSDPPSVLYSSNGGKDFSLKTINMGFVNNCTAANFGSMVDKNTWYVTMGPAPQRQCFRYFSHIVKTTDGGNTWTTQLTLSKFLFSAIDCLSATHCVALGGDNVGLGYVTGLAFIYGTVDGHTWNLVFVGDPNGFLYFLRASTHGHFTAAGYKTNQAGTSNVSYTVTSVDGGVTWNEESPISNIQAITSLSFTPGGVGFATAVGDSGDSTILRYDPAPSQLPH